MINVIVSKNFQIDIKKIYDDFIKVSDSKTLIANRNDVAVVRPFLSAVGCKYLQIQNLILVLDDEDCVPKLKRLGFSRIEETYYHSKVELRKMLSVADKLKFTQLYNTEFNIELHVVDMSQWAICNVVYKLIQDLDIDSDSVLNTFVRMYSSLNKLDVIKYFKCL